jgi:pimeloyl-ACP methyl ester carboxylesterase
MSEIVVICIRTADQIDAPVDRRMSYSVPFAYVYPRHRLIGSRRSDGPWNHFCKDKATAARLDNKSCATRQDLDRSVAQDNSINNTTRPISESAAMTFSRPDAIVGAETGSELPPIELLTISGPTSDMAGMKIGFRQAGSRNNTAIVCLHGIGSNSSGYQAQLRDLSDSYRVIAWEAPGYGNSDPLPWLEPRPENYADALAGLVDALALKSIIMVGSSFGAVIAATFAERYKDQTLGVVLSAPAAGFAAAPEAERAEVLNKRIGDMKRFGPARIAAERSKVLVAPDASPEIVSRATELVASVHPAGYIQAAHAIDMADTVAVASRLTVPTLVLVGTKDVVTPRATCAEPIFKNLKNGKIEIFEGIGHLLKLEAPQMFNKVVRQFVARPQTSF